MGASKGLIIFIVVLGLLLLSVIIALIVVSARLLDSSECPPLMSVSTMTTVVTYLVSYSDNDAGELLRLDHDFRGYVYSLDNKRMRITGLNYDGQASEAFFWIGLKGNPSNTPKTQSDSLQFESDHVTQSDSLQSDHVIQSDSFQSDHVTQSDSRQSDHVTQSDSLQPDHVTQSDSLQSDHITQSNSLQSDHITQSDSLQSDHITQSDSLQSDHVTQSDSLQS